MMDTKPEAYRLADELSRAATELRFLFQEKVDYLAELRRLHSVNQELLEALKAIAAPNALNSDHRVEACREALREIARAAIAKAEGGV